MDNLDLLQNADYAKKLENFKNCELLHDICVQDVKYYCCQYIDLEIPIPAESGGLANGCRGKLIPVDPDVDCDVRVTCADEHLKPTCDGVDIQVGFQVTLIPPDPQQCPVMVINHIEHFECTVFYKFPTCEPVCGEQLREALKMIDGSCIVTENLNCEILFDTNCARVRITGCLIDKLWKKENLWLLAWAPFSGTTVKQEFGDGHQIGPCTVPCPIPVLNNDPHKNGGGSSPCAKQK